MVMRRWEFNGWAVDSGAPFSNIGVPLSLLYAEYDGAVVEQCVQDVFCPTNAWWAVHIGHAAPQDPMLGSGPVRRAHFGGSLTALKTSDGEDFGAELAKTDALVKGTMLSGSKVDAPVFALSSIGEVIENREIARNSDLEIVGFHCGDRCAGDAAKKLALIARGWMEKCYGLAGGAGCQETIACWIFWAVVAHRGERGAGDVSGGSEASRKHHERGNFKIACSYRRGPLGCHEPFAAGAA